MTEHAVTVPPPRDGFADAREEARELEGATFEERYALLRAACALVFDVLEHHPERELILSQRDPLPPDFAAVFERARHARPAGAPGG
ncbi:MAG: hypothetical protein L6Q84_05445 [Polyangiaceae bacterium]|nr:hypothetical protein [Polyangiaceae bacterium]